MTEQSMLPMLIQVFAGFTKLDGRVEQDEMDSILGFLRYDYPETVYTELRQLFIDALGQKQDLEAIAETLGRDLADRGKGSSRGAALRSHQPGWNRKREPDHFLSIHDFDGGRDSEAVNIVYQLNTSDLDSLTRIGSETPEESIGNHDEEHRLETVIFSSGKLGDVPVIAISQEIRR